MTDPPSIPEPPSEAFVPGVDRIFVTGGSGFVGRRILRRFADTDVEVRGLARSDDAAEVVRNEGAEPIRGDLADREALEEGMRECDAAVHAAALVDDWGPRDTFEAVNVEGTRNVLAAAREPGIDRLVHVGTEAVVAEGRPLVRIGENHPVADNPVSTYAWSKAEAERAVLEAADDELETVVVRPRFVWGVGDRSILPAFVDAVESGNFAWIQGGSYETSTTHVENAAEGILRAIEFGRSGEIYFVTDGDPVEFRTFVTEMLATRGIEPPDRSIPHWLARLAARLCESIWALFGLGGSPPITRTATDLMGLEVTIDDAKARRELAYEPVVDREEGLRELRERGGDG